MAVKVEALPANRAGKGEGAGRRPETTAPGPIALRGLSIDPPLLLAPMAGLTHSALRCRILGFGGVGLLYTEMLSGTRVVAEVANPAASPFLVRLACERPLAYQVLVTRATDVTAAVRAVERLGAQMVDINLGCPAPKVRKKGGGIGLAQDLDALRRIVAEARLATALPLSAKIRLGPSLDERRLERRCRLLEEEGVDLLVVHARLDGEPFSRPARWDWVARVKSFVSIPVVANGGIDTVDAAWRCLAQSGADGLMIGREAAARPWIFALLARALYGGEVTLPRDPAEVWLAFYDHLEAHFPPTRRLGRLKEFTHYFQRNYAFGHHLAYGVQTSGDMAEARERALAFFARNTPKPDVFVR